MYGIIGKMVAVDGKRDELIQILLEGTKEMPGCLGYVVSRDASDTNSLWVVEYWSDRDSHRASLGLPRVQHAISQGRPLIAGFGDRFEVEPMGGVGPGVA